MIQFKTDNGYGEVLTYQYDGVEELEKIWRSDDIDMDVPANDAIIFDVVVDGKSVFSAITEATFERIGTDSVWFEDLLTYLGIEIWC